VSTTYAQSVCRVCGGHSVVFSLKLIATSNRDPRWPKYVPQIKAVCGEDKCGEYIKFARQTPEMIETINALLDEIAW
jgi:hypothetical protein